MCRFSLPTFAFSIICSLALPGAARADDKYYLLLFASQGQPTIPRWSHTFATFVKASGAGDHPAKWKLETHTISWLPASGAVLPRFKSDRGRNYDLPDSLATARSQNARVYLWGPHETNAEFYELAKKRIAQLESGAWAYRLLDGKDRHLSICNCAHAVCDLVPGEPLITGTSFGEGASAKIARYFQPWLIEPEKTHDWLLDRLDLKGQNLQRRNSFVSAAGD